MKKTRKFFKRLLLIGLLLFIVITTCNYLVERNASAKKFNSVKQIKANKVGLVLGTTKYLRNGRVNLYYKYRVEAAVKLYKGGKVKYLLISGDNGEKGYDEPTDFKKDLIAKGVPESKIYLDYAGFRTLDSVVRAKEIFGQESITIISQEFHNERAIYLADYFNINAIGFNARGISGKYGLKVRLREYLARVKLFVDLAIGTKPKFLGEKIKIG